MQKYIRHKSKKKDGITLIALVITIIVLLILAGISISMLSGDNSILSKATQARDETEIAKEKEMIKMASMQALSKNKDRKLTQNDLQLEIGADKANVYDNGDGFTILFKSNRIYTINSKGSLEDTITNYEVATKKLTNELTNTTFGTEEKPYEINCIEDLVDLSYKVNGIVVDENGTLTYTNSRNTFASKYIILTKNLNFKLPLSYENSTRKDYGDINGNGKVEELLTELTTGTGWIPIGGNGHGNIAGSFNGNNYIISKLYINKKEEDSVSALFGAVGNSSASITIQNLKVTGNIYCNSSSTAGILCCIYNGEKRIENCSFEGKIENIRDSNGYTAGVISNTGINCTIDRCCSKGIIKGKSYIGGIVAQASSSTILNCYNESNISLGYTVGGIAATGGGIISNCYNIGTIQGEGSNYHGAGGIIGYRKF